MEIFLILQHLPTYYTSPGVYDITLTYTTSGGCVDSVKKIKGIVVGPKPAANYIADPLDACAFKEINFTDKTSGNPDKWVWFFGDGGSAVNQNPSHLYNDTGYFSVTLIAINNGCADTITNINQVHIHPPVARFSFMKTCTVPRQAIFNDQSIGADYWLWDFGDGTTSTEQNPTHDYPNPGTIYSFINRYQPGQRMFGNKKHIQLESSGSCRILM